MEEATYLTDLLYQRLEDEVDLKEGNYLHWIEYCKNEGIGVRQIEQWNPLELQEHFNLIQILDKHEQENIFRVFRKNFRETLENADSLNDLKNEYYKLFTSPGLLEEYKEFIDECLKRELSVEDIKHHFKDSLPEFGIQTKGAQAKLKLLLDGTFQEYLGLLNALESSSQLEELGYLVENCSHQGIRVEQLTGASKQGLKTLLDLDCEQTLEKFSAIIEKLNRKSIQARLEESKIEVGSEHIQQFLKYCCDNNVSLKELSSWKLDKYYKIKDLKNSQINELIKTFKDQEAESGSGWDLLMNKSQIETRETLDTSLLQTNFDNLSSSSDDDFEKVQTERNSVPILDTIPLKPSTQQNLCENISIPSALSETGTQASQKEEKRHSQIVPTKTQNNHQKLKSCYKLIEISKSIQNEQAIEKLVLNEENIVELANFFKQGSATKDSCEGYQINFRTIDSVAIRTIGLFGRIKLIEQYLDNQFGNGFCLKNLDYIDAQQPGLYFIPYLEHHGVQIHIVLLWAGQNEKMVNSKNHSNLEVLMVRFLSQLAPHILVFLKKEDINNLTLRNPLNNSTLRKIKYEINNQQLAKESVSVEKGFTIDFKENLDLKSTLELINSGPNSYACVFERLEPQEREKSYKNLLKVDKLKQYLDFRIGCSNFVFSETLTNGQKVLLLELLDQEYMEERRSIDSDFEQALRENLKSVSKEFLKMHRIKCVVFELKKNFYQESIVLQEYLKNRSFWKLSYENWKDPDTITMKNKFSHYHSELRVLIQKYKEKEFLPREYSVIMRMLTDKRVSTHLTTLLLNTKFTAEERAERIISENKEKKGFLDHFKFGSTNKSVLVEKAEKFCRDSKLQFDESFMEDRIEKFLNDLEKIIEDCDYNASLENKPLFKKCIDEIVTKNLNDIYLPKKCELLQTRFALLEQRFNKKNENIGKMTKVYSILKSTRWSFFNQEYNVHFGEFDHRDENFDWRFYKLVYEEINQIPNYNNEKDSALSPSLILVSKDIRTIAFSANFWKFPLKNDKIMFVYNKSLTNSSEFTIYNVKSGAKGMVKSFGKPISHTDFDSKDNYWVIISDNGKQLKLVVYFFAQDYRLFNQEMEIDINFQLNIQKVHFMKLEYGKKGLWILDGDYVLRRIGIKTQKCSPQLIKFPKDDPIKDVICNTSGSCLIIVSSKKISAVLTDTFKTFEFPTEEGSIKYPLSAMTLNSHNNNQQHLVFFDEQYKKVCSHHLIVQAACNELQVQEIYQQNEAKSEKTQNDTTSFLDYFFEIFDKYSSRSLLIAHENQYTDIHLQVVLESNENLKENKERIYRYMVKLIEKLEKTHKPLEGVNLLKNLCFASDIDDPTIEVFKNATHQQIAGTWLQNLICFLPIQIARAEGNCFQILHEGFMLLLEDISDAYDLKDKIKFGLYEAILNDWKKDVKVISSMGKQSTGKSYTLNHLTGASFAVSGARCTDGCWMTMKITPNCLYIILDFEGFGSFERSEQEDMLLSVFNSAISGITLFKTEYRLERDLEQWFSRFNSGAALLKESKKLFQGLFNIVIKDVADRDIEELRKEFEQKIQIIIKKAGKKNFLQNLYKGFQIHPFPSLETPAYYREMMLIKEDVEDLPVIFTSGRDFMETIKLLMAKLTIQDFSSLDRQELDMRIKYIRSLLPCALMYGQTSEDEKKLIEFSLRSLDNLEETISSTVELQIPLNPQPLKLDDLNMRLTPSEKEENNNQFFLNRFLEIMKPKSTNIGDWNKNYRDYTKARLEARFKRVATWIELNTKAFKEDDDSVGRLKLEFKVLCDSIQRVYEICQDKCLECYAACIHTNSSRHKHLCATDHLCDEFCDYCKTAGEKIKCSEKFAHEGRHACRQRQHTCDHPCKYQQNQECDRACSLKIGHENDHKCDSKDHKCKKPCSLNGCTGLCDLNADSVHTVHKCFREQCLTKCVIKTCENMCATKDHFHCNPELSKKFREENNIPLEQEEFEIKGEQPRRLDQHICGKIHQCDQYCEMGGFCKVSKEKKVTEKQFKGKRGTITYNKMFEEVGELLQCMKEIPKFETQHLGDHVHTLDIEFKHACTHKCPTCENICDKPFSHEGRHTTSHGNMSKCYFVANQEDIDIGDHKYVVGEPAEPEMCHMFCKTLGRGHVHILECDSMDGECMYGGGINGRRHQTCEYGPHETKNIPKDELKHSMYWETINFEDPCTEEESKEAEECPFYCSFTEHDEYGKKEILYCQLGLWHEKAESLQKINRSFGSISGDGHHYSCSHKKGKGNYIVFVLDSSGSMEGQKWDSLIMAVDKFVAIRTNYCKDDLMTIISYDTHAKIICEMIKITEYEKIRSFVQHMDGGTNYDDGLEKADEVLSRANLKQYSPVIIFFSDGRPTNNRNGVKKMRNLSKKFLKDELQVFTMGLGSDVNIDTLKLLALEAEGTYVHSVDIIQLKESFGNLAASIGKVNIGVKSRK